MPGIFGSSFFFHKLINRLYYLHFSLYRRIYFIYKALSEREEIDLMKNTIKPGDVVVDVGANIGFYTLLFSDLVGSKGKVYAFEPEPENFEHLRKLCNGRNNIKLVNAAVSDKSGSINLYLSSELNVDHYTFKGKEERNVVKVRSVSLDKYFNKRRKIDFVKIDTQGFEYNVLTGFKRTARRLKKLIIFCEVVPERLKQNVFTKDRLFNRLKNWGFTIKRIGKVTKKPLYYFNIMATKV